MIGVMETARSGARRSRCFLAVVACAMSGACGNGNPTEPARSVASVAQEAGDQRITTSVTAFADMLRQVNYGNKVLVAVRASSVAALDRESVLREPAATDWVMLLPSASETGAERRNFTGGFASASQQDVQALAALLRSRGATQVSTFVNFPLISAALPSDGDRLRGVLGALAGQPNFDYAEPDQARSAVPQ